MTPELSRRLGRIGLEWWGASVDLRAAVELRNAVTAEAVKAGTYEAMPTWARNEVTMREALMARGVVPGAPTGVV